MKVRNYFILLIIYIITILLVMYFFFLYKNHNSVNIDSYFNTVINKAHDESYDEIILNLDNYMIENKEFILYVNYDSEFSKEYELKLRDFILDKNVSDLFISLRILDDKLNIVYKIFEYYGYNYNSEIKLPLYLYFNDGIIVDSFSGDLNFDNLYDWVYGLGVYND